MEEIGERDQKGGREGEMSGSRDEVDGVRVVVSVCLSQVAAEELWRERREV